MTFHRTAILVLAGFVPLPLAAQAGRTGAATAAPQRAATPQGGTSPQAGVVPGTQDNANRDILLSPSESVQQFRQQRATALNTPGTTAAALPGTSLTVPGAGLPPGAVVGAQVLQIVPGTSITVMDLSGVTRTFPLPANDTVPAGVTSGSYVALTALNGGYVTVANANGVLPSSTVAGGEPVPSLAQIAAANGSVTNPNLTTRQIAPQSAITGIGGFYAPGAAPGYVETPGATLAGAGYVAAPNAPTGIPATGPLTSISWSDTSLAAAVARAQGTRTLPAAATRPGALATIEGVGRHIVTRTAVTSWRVVSWDGETLVVQDDRGQRRRFAVAEGTPMPRELRPGQLVVLDVRDDALRSVRRVL